MYEVLFYTKLANGNAKLASGIVLYIQTYTSTGY